MLEKKDYDFPRLFTINIKIEDKLDEKRMHRDNNGLVSIYLVHNYFHLLSVQKASDSVSGQQVKEK